jgi:hypothetical protein
VPEAADAEMMRRRGQLELDKEQLRHVEVEVLSRVEQAHRDAPASPYGVVLPDCARHYGCLDELRPGSDDGE